MQELNATFIINSMIENNSRYFGVEQDKFNERLEKLWIHSDEKCQEKNIVQIMYRDDVEDDLKYKLWDNTSQKAQEETIISIMEGKRWDFGSDLDKIAIWEKTKIEVQERKLIDVIKIAPEVFKKTNIEVQKNSIIDIFKNQEIIDKGRIWNLTDEIVKKEKIKDIMQDEDIDIQLKDYILGNITTDIEHSILNGKNNFDFSLKELIQDEGIDRKIKTCLWIRHIYEQIEVSDRLKDIIESDPKNAVYIWQRTDHGVQRQGENEKLVYDIIKNNPAELWDIWKYTDESVQESNLRKIIEDEELSYLNKSEIWRASKPKAQLKCADLLKDIMEKNPSSAYLIWQETYGEVQSQKENAGLVCKIIENNPVEASEIFKGTYSTVAKLNNFLSIIKNLKIISTQEDYEKFVKNYLGNIEFSEDGNAIIPKELEDIIFNATEEEQAKVVEFQLPAIIKNWYEIKEYIQNQKANANLKEDGLEIRTTNIKNILKAVKALNAPKPQTCSAQEYEDTDGSERCGVDTQYTVSISTAVQRAYTVAVKMDEASSLKKYPDFSVTGNRRS